MLIERNVYKLRQSALFRQAAIALIGPCRVDKATLAVKLGSELAAL